MLLAKYRRSSLGRGLCPDLCCTVLGSKVLPKHSPRCRREEQVALGQSGREQADENTGCKHRGVGTKACSDSCKKEHLQKGTPAWSALQQKHAQS